MTDLMILNRLLPESPFPLRRKRPDLVKRWWTPATSGGEETSHAVRHCGLPFLFFHFTAEGWFTMAAAIDTHGTVGVAALCQHSLPSSALVDASSRSPLEGNKSADALHFNDFPTVAFQNGRAL